MGGRTFQVRSVGQDIIFDTLFFLSVVKINSSKHKNIPQKSDVF